MKKRGILFLSGVVALSAVFAGCGGAANKQASSVKEGEKMTLELWTSSRDAIDNPDAWYIRKLEDEFDVNIEMKYRNEGGSDYTEWLTLALAGDDAPDWFRDQGVSTAMLNDLVKQGLVAELDPETVKENMPNYMEWAAKYSDIMTEDPLNLYSVDGKVYAIPDAKVDLGKFCLMAYRQDWLDNLGLKAPDTLDEFTEVMKAFTFDDPDGNGVNDTYGYIGITGDTDWAFSPVFAAFGTYPGIWYAKDDGTVTRGEIEPGTKEALRYIKELYDMGVIDPEWMTIDFEGAKNKVISSVVGCSWQNWLTILTPDGWWSALNETVPEAGWNISTGMKGKDGQRGIMQFNPLAGAGLVFGKHMQNQPEKLAKYLQVFDAIAGDPAWHEAEIWGMEGETFVKNENGEREYTKEYETEDARIKYGIGTAYRFPSLELFQYDPDLHDEIDYTAQVNEIRKGTLEIIEGKYDVLGGYFLPVWNDVRAELPDMNVVFAEMITGERDIEEFDTVVAEWMDKGGRNALEEAQEIYDAHFK